MGNGPTYVLVVQEQCYKGHTDLLCDYREVIMCEYHDRQRDICSVLHASDNENYATDKNMKMG